MLLGVRSVLGVLLLGRHSTPTGPRALDDLVVKVDIGWEALGHVELMRGQLTVQGIPFFVLTLGARAERPRA